MCAAQNWDACPPLCPSKTACRTNSFWASEKRALQHFPSAPLSTRIASPQEYGSDEPLAPGKENRFVASPGGTVVEPCARAWAARLLAAGAGSSRGPADGSSRRACVPCAPCADGAEVETSMTPEKRAREDGK